MPLLSLSIDLKLALFQLKFSTFLRYFDQAFFQLKFSESPLYFYLPLDLLKLIGFGRSWRRGVLFFPMPLPLNINISTVSTTVSTFVP
jgi:hypothetical protein